MKDKIIELIPPVAILTESDNPSLFYWFPEAYENSDYVLIDLKEKKLNPSFDNFNSVLIIRYIHNKYINALSNCIKDGKRVVLFIDDNLFGNINPFNCSIKYSFTIWWKIKRYKNVLNKYVSEIWVTNTKLKSITTKKLTNQNISINILGLKNSLNFIRKKKIYRISYFGSSSHEKELKWLKGMLFKLQSTRNDCIIEIIVNQKWRRKLRDIPRIKMIYPMSWDSFLLDTRDHRIDIALVPLFSSNFNDTRSPTKFYDVTRLNAVGIYSNINPYKEFINNNYDGILLDNNEEEWVKKINYLLKEENEREYILSNAIKKINKLNNI